MKKGSKMSEETRLKMKKSQQKRMLEGRHNFFKGHGFSRETKRKMSLSRIGKPSPRKGQKASKETIEKMKISMTPVWKSKKYREGARKRMLGKKQSPETIRKRFAWMEGYRHSKKTIEKIKNSHKKRFENHVYKTDESVVARKKNVYKIWRIKVYTRDDFTCQKCLKRGGDLHPHHIKNFKEHVELRYITKNGITFCVMCHREFHKKYGKKNNNKKQILEFIKS